MFYNCLTEKVNIQCDYTQCSYLLCCVFQFTQIALIIIGNYPN